MQNYIKNLLVVCLIAFGCNSQAMFDRLENLVDQSKSLNSRDLLKELKAIKSSLGKITKDDIADGLKVLRNAQKRIEESRCKNKADLKNRIEDIADELSTKVNATDEQVQEDDAVVADLLAQSEQSQENEQKAEQDETQTTEVIVIASEESREAEPVVMPGKLFEEEKKSEEQVQPQEALQSEEKEGKQEEQPAEQKPAEQVEPDAEEPLAQPGNQEQQAELSKRSIQDEQEDGDEQQDEDNQQQNPSSQSSWFGKVVNGRNVALVGVTGVVAGVAIIAKKIYDIDPVANDIAQLSTLLTFIKQVPDTRASFASDELHSLVISVVGLTEQERNEFIECAVIGNRAGLIQYIEKNFEAIIERARGLTSRQLLEAKLTIWFNQLVNPTVQ